MHILRILLALIGMLLVTSLDLAEAAKKKTAPPASQKAIYEAPMRVFIVRNSSSVCEPNCPEWIGAEGEITAATPGQFRKVFKQMGKKKLPVVIRSPGGSIIAALEIGRMIRKAGLSVAVGHTQFTGCSPSDTSCKLPPENGGIYQGIITDIRSFCNSACPMILAGGVTRLAGPFASIGLHEPKTIWTREHVRYRETYRLVGGKKKILSRKIVSRKTVKDKVTFGLDKRLRKNLTSHYRSMGVDVAILDDTVKAKYQDIYYISEIRKSMLKLVTSSSSAVMLANPKYCGSASVCVVDKTRDPTLVLSSSMGKAGLNSLVPEMTFKLAHLKGSDCLVSCPAWIAAEGRITDKTPDLFDKFLKTLNVKNLTVVLNSQGGDLKAAISLGQKIRSNNLDTAVGRSKFEKASTDTAKANAKPTAAGLQADGLCQGGCLLAFTGGKQRNSSTSAEVILHNPATYQALTGSAGDIVAMNLHLRDMGVSPTFMTSLYDIEIDKPRRFNHQQLMAYLVTSDVRPLGEIYSLTLCRDNAMARGCYFKSVEPTTPVVEPPQSEQAMQPILAMPLRENCSQNCPMWIYAEGRIQASTLTAFKKLFADLGPRKLPIILHSSTGDYHTSMNLGQLFREYEVEVAVAKVKFSPCENCGSQLGVRSVTPAIITTEGQCGSSCVIAFAGGLKRLGFSDVPLFVDSLSAYNIANVQHWRLQDYFYRMGMERGLMHLIQELEPGKSHGIVGKSQSLLGLVNSGKLPDWLARPENCESAEAPSRCL